MRRAQLQHVFAFIMLIVIASVVLLLGYRFITKLLGDQCRVETIQFTNLLEKSLKDYAAYGTRKTVALSLPCGAVRLCFVDASRYNKNGDIYIGTTNPSLFTTSNKVILDEVQHPTNPTPANIFLIQEKNETHPLQFFAEKVTLANQKAPLCIDATAGQFRIAFNGQGRTALIKDGS